MASPTLQVKRGLFVNLPALRAGEPGFTTDKYDLYLGTGAGTTASNQFYGSSRYWTRENGTNAAQFKLVDKDGTNGVSLRSPATVNTPVTYTLPEGGATQGHFLRLGSAGVLEWASVSADATFTNASFTGIATFSGLIDANAGLDVSGGSTFDNINVTGIATVGTTLDVNGLADLTNVNVSVAATIASADINGGTIDATIIGGSTAAAGTFTQLAYSNSSTSGISTVGSLYVSSTKVLSTEGGLVTLSGIATIDATTKATLEQILSLDPNDFSTLNVAGISTIGGLLDANGGLDVLGHSELDTVNVSGLSTFAGLVDVNGGLDVTGLATLNTGLNVTSGVSTFAGLVEADGGLDVLGHSELDTLNVSGVSTFVGNITATGGVTGNLTGLASTATKLQNAQNFSITGGFVTASAISFDGSGAVALAATITADSIVLGTYTSGNYVASVIGTANEVEVTGTGEGAAVQVGLPAEVLITTSLDVPTVEATNLKARDGTTSITISDVTGNVGISSNLTVTGNLYVAGSTTQVNTTSLQVEDRVIELGKVQGDAPSDTSWDLGILFNYHTASENKKASVYWEHSASRFLFASDVSESVLGINLPDTGAVGLGTTTPQLTSPVFAPIEIGSLWVNDCAGASQVISCTGTERFLENITVDAGVF